MVHSITTMEELEAEFEKGKNKGKLIVLDFFATWCGPCLRVAPKIDDWSSGEFKDTVVFLKCDVDQGEAVSQEFNVEAMPTFVFFKDGKEIHRVVGANVDQLKADIESHRK
ncbi:unnamed protein product [Adineta steineri]|uniref:Thioredoxin n=1 Tax=Adineta steineri TaxID=433720 RepID=A0A813ZV56_9BILA|nr:unnamed protein product [Adineta steineri]CAF1182307.1 unnamed protein product [Adineta steineri]CAF1463035.1 unnamed protein product [Adineta steineri]CAF1494008.1 unnamed protein product [Adineta steineri]CAF1642312.1 unnamed protein product [Adineta steineri]